MKKRSVSVVTDFEDATRDWIVSQVGLSGFYEISRIKRMENEGLLQEKASMPVEFATILSMMRQNGKAYTVPPQSRVGFDDLLYKERQLRNIKLEGEKTLIFESEVSKRLSRYSKIFKIFPHSETLGDYDTRVFSSLYDQMRHSFGGTLGRLFFNKAHGKTHKGNKLTVYLFLAQEDFGKSLKALLADPSVPKRIFVKSGAQTIEKDPLLASIGLLKVKSLSVSHSGIIMGCKNKPL